MRISLFEKLITYTVSTKRVKTKKFSLSVAQLSTFSYIWNYTFCTDRGADNLASNCYDLAKRMFEIIAADNDPIEVSSFNIISVSQKYNTFLKIANHVIAIMSYLDRYYVNYNALPTLLEVANQTFISTNRIVDLTDEVGM